MNARPTTATPPPAINHRHRGDLLAQVASSKEEEHDVRRRLSAPLLTEADLDANNAPKSVWPHCCGTCDQGRRPCITPEACQRPEPPAAQSRSLWRAMFFVLALWAVGAATLIVMGVRP